MSNKIAVAAGVRGQDSSYLSELLLDKGYTVIGMERRLGEPNYCNIEHLFSNPNFILEQGDITDFSSITRLLQKYNVDEFYNLAAQSFVAASWNQALATSQINYMGPANCLEVIRLVSPKTKFFQASTSEVYGDVLCNVQNEDTPARPRSPYAAAKYGAESLVKVYRDSYGLFACFARSFNHEAPRRASQFVTRKITSWIGEAFKIADENIDRFIKTKDLEPCGPSYVTTQMAFDLALQRSLITPLHLGNIEAMRDWSHAKDIVEGIYLMLQNDKPKDYVLASGETRSVREFIDSAFSVIGIKDWSKFVVIDPKFYRPADVALLCGDSSRARKDLGWQPKISFDSLVEEMVKNDCGI